ncbi:MAG: diguanylate cyclase [Frankiales bacterium]|nr:diguanylate cyclase [Frankiales bacterium]
MGWLKQRGRRLSGNTAEALGGGALFAVLSVTGLAGDIPPVALLGTWAVVLATCLPSVQRWLAGGRLRRTLDARSGIAALCGAALLYGMGWGPLFTSGLVIVVVTQIRENGSRVWRSSLVWCVLTASLGQVLVLVDVLPSYASTDVGNAAFLVGITAMVLLGRALGTTTAQAEAEVAARTHTEARFRSLVENSHDLVFLMTPAGEATWVSPASSAVLGYPPEALLGNGWMTLVHPDDLTVGLDGLSTTGAAGGQGIVVVRGRHRDGSWHWWEVTQTDRLADPAVGAIVANLRDVTDSHAYQERLSYQATRDSLTGLLNRAAFLEHLESALARASRKPSPAAVLFLDLNDFKCVNDQWGHHAGDVLLQAVAFRLEQAVRPGDTVGRLAGDEFVVLLEDLGTAGDAEIVADRIRLALESPVLLAGHQVAPTASIGIAVTAPWCLESADDLLHVADLRMYDAKQRRRRGIHPSSHDLATLVALDDGEYGAGTVDGPAIARGLTEREFFLEYQPVVELATGRSTWVEALVRWNHPQLGRLAPDSFIPQVEACGLMTALGRRVLEDGCRAVQSWSSDPRIPPITLAINASVSQLRDLAFPQVVRDVLASTGFPAGQLVIELTETLPVMPHDAALTALAALAALGVRTALDDFGAGAASLAQLDLVSAEIVKLDRQLINRIEKCENGFLQGLIGFLLSRGAVLIAEGIENAAQLEALTASGAQFGQGYHLARPGSAETARDFLAASLLPQVRPARVAPGSPAEREAPVPARQD